MPGARTVRADMENPKMSIRDYYLPLSSDVFGSVVFLGIEAKMEGIGPDRTQKHTADALPVWTVTVLAQRGTNIPEVEVVSLVADKATADALAELSPMTPVVLDGLEAGKWSRQGNDTTTWSFRTRAVIPAGKR
jgi:hypothetical protein